ncbi:unnamed protein product [Triticum turgidum subsp. durum]|uniref:Uncharacterized protein n=1 Tax=Triticum turgidum subsp. durum TaxID=4567 RepID=A0A9R0SAL0_TRITD|nr:unnamed protein product [Triticum turgidum subsp. durum]
MFAQCCNFYSSTSSCSNSPSAHTVQHLLHTCATSCQPPMLRWTVARASGGLANTQAGAGTSWLPWLLGVPQDIHPKLGHHRDTPQKAPQGGLLLVHEGRHCLLSPQDDVVYNIILHMPDFSRDFIVDAD